MTKNFRRLITLFFCLQILINAQTKVNSLSVNQNKSFDKILFGASDTRNVFLINDGWKVYQEDGQENKASINIPATFEGNDVLIFEKKIELTQQQLDRYEIKLGILGLNNSAEISVNGNIISNHYGGAYPFEVNLPKDLLRSDAANKISIKINKKLDSETTIPTKQRFLFPNLDGGVIRDVYLKLVPHLSISKIDFTSSVDQLTFAKINFDVLIENIKSANTIDKQTQFYVHVNILSPVNGLAISKGDYLQTIYNEDNFNACFQLDVASPSLWSPSSPNFYICEVTIIKDGAVVDKQERQIAFYNLKKNQNELLINGSPFVLNGTTYFPNETFSRKTNIYEKLKEDLTFIKQTGFNAVRFAKSYPHPYALKVCQEIGLIPLIELPLNSIPEEFLSQNDYQLKIAGFIKEFYSNYYNYSNSFVIGIGSGFLANSSVTEKFISKIAGEIKKKSILTFASFSGWQNQLIDNIDFYGFEIFSAPVDDLSKQIQPAIQALGKSSILLSEVTYPNYKGSATGYLVRNSNEAQAKYFDGIVNLVQKEKISGFFINSLLKFQGSFISLYSSYASDQFYNFSVLDFSKNTNSIAYKLLYSRLNNGAKVTIPIGSRKDDSPIIFILIALFLSVVMAVLINTKRKFRDDATRALLRPYNFFSDIRDHRIISGIHSALLMLIIAASASLLFTIILFYLRNDLMLEKLLLTFASTRIMKAICFLAWNPQICFVVLFIISMLKILLLSAIIKIASLFIKTKVPSANIFFAVVWSFLPLTLFLPIELVLFKVLSMGSINSFAVWIIIAYFLWLLIRLLKGIYVIFDVRPLLVYLYSFLICLLSFGGILLKYQLTHSIIYFITTAIKQYNSMIN